MFDMTSYIPRYFKIKLKNGKILDVEPPKLKVLKKIMKLAKNNKNDVTGQDFENLIVASSLALSKNKQNYTVTEEWITDNHNIDELMELLTNYFDWVDEINNSKN